MLKKEFAAIGLPVLTRLTVVLILPTAFWLAKKEFGSSVAILLIICLNVGIAWTANHLGLSAFKSERNDRAWEYLLTFPYSRRRILLNKTAPRLLVLAGLVGAYSLIVPWVTGTVSNPAVPSPFKGSSFEVFMSPWPITLLSLMLFVTGLSLSLFDLRSMRILAGLPGYLLFVLMVEAGWARLYLPEQATGLLPNWNLAALFVTAIAGISFWLVFRRFDLREEAAHRRRYLAFALPPALLAFAATLARILAR